MKHVMDCGRSTRVMSRSMLDCLMKVPRMWVGRHDEADFGLDIP